MQLHFDLWSGESTVFVVSTWLSNMIPPPMHFLADNAWLSLPLQGAHFDPAECHGPENPMFYFSGDRSYSCWASTYAWKMDGDMDLDSSVGRYQCGMREAPTETLGESREDSRRKGGRTNCTSLQVFTVLAANARSIADERVEGHCMLTLMNARTKTWIGSLIAVMMQMPIRLPQKLLLFWLKIIISGCHTRHCDDNYTNLWRSHHEKWIIVLDIYKNGMRHVSATYVPF